MNHCQEYGHEASSSIGPRVNPRTTMLGLRVAFLGVILFGAFCILRSDHDFRRDRPSLFWPVAAGTITGCEARFYGGLHAHYGVNVTYSYDVNGARLVSHQIELWNPGLTSDRQTATSFLRTHPVQSVVAVYYDPSRPVKAALIPGADETGNNVAFTCGSILLLAGIWGFFKSLPGFRAPGQATPATQDASGGRVSPHDRTI
jgi:hypothetical protein